MQIKKSSFPLLGLCFFIGHIPKNFIKYSRQTQTRQRHKLLIAIKYMVCFGLFVIPFSSVLILQLFPCKGS